MLEDVFLPIVLAAIFFIGVPWLIFHYVTQWKKSGSVTVEDERLMDELYETARRLEDRLQTIERIIAADNPDFARLRHEPRAREDRLDRDDDPRERAPIRTPRDEDDRRARS